MTRMFCGNKILLVCEYWKTIFFQWLWVTLILFDHDTSCVGKLIFLALHAYEEHPKQRSYASCASI
jgi:hypothetical protein